MVRNRDLLNQTYCPRCGTVLPPRLKNCPRCGCRVSSNKSKKRQRVKTKTKKINSNSVRKCEKCKTIVEGIASDLCPNCNTPLSGDSRCLVCNTNLHSNCHNQLLCTHDHDLLVKFEPRYNYLMEEIPHSFWVERDLELFFVALFSLLAAFILTT